MLQNEEVVGKKTVSDPRLRRPPRRPGVELQELLLEAQDLEEEDLKPERVQDALRADHVRKALKTMPGWRALPGIRGIDRVRRFPAPDVADAYAGFVKAFAEEVGQRYTVVQIREHVTVTLFGRRGKRYTGVTRSVLDFAKRLG
jgi:hypothetical protein